MLAPEGWASSFVLVGLTVSVQVQCGTLFLDVDFSPAPILSQELGQG